MRQKILRSISVLLISLLYPIFSGVQPLQAQNQNKQDTKEEKEAEDLTKPAPVFAGVAVSADLVGVVMKLMDNDYAQMEVAARLNFKERFFPIFELGYGESDFTSDETGNVYKAKAPYFRIGLDYNFKKNWRSGSRLYGGLRYAFTSFNYDLAVPGFNDPVWNRPVEFNYKDLKANYHWAEAVFGIETRIWSIFRLGWDVRYKLRFAHSESSFGSPWYIPGFGKNSSSCLGGTFKVIFDI